MLTLDLIEDITNKKIILSEKEHKEFLILILDDQEQLNDYVFYIGDYIQSILKEDWYVNFLVSIMKKYDNHILFDLFIFGLHTKNKDDFIFILKKMKCFYFFKHNYFKFNYSDLEKIEIIPFLNDFIIYKPIDYQLKIDVFQRIGLIPLFLITTEISLYQDNFTLETFNNDINLIIKYFNFLTIEEKIKIVINTFFHEYSNKYITIDPSVYQYFFEKLYKENNEIIDYLISKEKDHIESEFLIFAIKIQEEVNCKHNISNF